MKCSKYKLKHSVLFYFIMNIEEVLRIVVLYEVILTEKSLELEDAKDEVSS